MTRIAAMLLLGSVLLQWTATAVQAGQFEDGVAAYDEGDYTAAVSLWRPLAAQGQADADYNLGFMYAIGLSVARDYTKAVELYREAALQGYADAQYSLGLMYKSGRGVTQNYQEALKWFRRAAEQGSLAAAFNLGVLYETGRGVPRDLLRAYMWYSASGAIAEVQNNKVETQGLDEIKSKLTPAQLAGAQQMAARCQGSGFKECE